MSVSTLSSIAWRQVALLTSVAIVLYIGMRNLPQGSDISHNDFRVNDRSAPQFCDAANPQFMPVISESSPVKMVLRGPDSPVHAGVNVSLLLTLTTSSGKPIAPTDLLVTHTRLLHLLVIDPTLDDYQHLHPEPVAGQAGTWRVSFTPRRDGIYRIFADFMPKATARGLYAACDLIVRPAQSVTNLNYTQNPRIKWELLVVGGENEKSPQITAGKQAELLLKLSSSDEMPIKLQLVMDAFAHLVAFDLSRSGYAHLHPLGAELIQVPDPLSPRFKFKVTIPIAGRYVLWAQMMVDGEERFQSFELNVIP